MTPNEEELFNFMNTFREDPTSIKDTITNLITGMKQLNPGNPAMKGLKKFYIPLKKHLNFIILVN